jgi:hypothetical protein
MGYLQMIKQWIDNIKPDKELHDKRDKLLIKYRENNLGSRH